MKPTNSLPELIDLAVSKHKTSVRQMSFTAQKNGYRVTATTLNQIRNGSYKSKPSKETLAAIAWLAGVDETLVYAAAGQPVPGPPLADELPPGADLLSPKSRKAVVEMVRVLVDLEAGSNGKQEDSEPGNSTGPRGLAPAGNSRSGQKNEPNYGITELHGDEARNIPVPPREQLAAHPKVKTTREKLDEETCERGSNSNPNE